MRGRPEAFGLLSRLPEWGFAVVGTRSPQARSLHLVRSRIQALEGTRLILLSGLALGVDSAAHEAALGSRLPTIAILGGSLDEIYPPENRGLALRIVENGGLLVTEFAPGTKIERHFFLLRNRLIAGWSKATWIVEASFRSGALNTASWAWDHDRDTYATPSFPGEPAFAGNQGLINRDKAHAFWELSSLGHSWKEFKNLGLKRRLNLMPTLGDEVPASDPHLLSDTAQLTQEVHRATLEQGGASVETLLEWALKRTWIPQRFFDVLQTCLLERRIEDHQGILRSTRRAPPFF